jgi:hypothetical protein
MSKDKFDNDLVSEKTWAAYGKAATAHMQHELWDGKSIPSLQAVIDEARVPEVPKSNDLLLGELVKAAESYKSVCGLTGSGGALDDLIRAALALADFEKENGDRR